MTTIDNTSIHFIFSIDSITTTGSMAINNIIQIIHIVASTCSSGCDCTTTAAATAHQSSTTIAIATLTITVATVIIPLAIATLATTKSTITITTLIILGSSTYRSRPAWIFC